MHRDLLPHATTPSDPPHPADPVDAQATGANELDSQPDGAVDEAADDSHVDGGGAVGRVAVEGAAEAARRAGVELRELSTSDATAAAAELFQQIWQTPAEAAPVSGDLMRALCVTGNYVAGAYAEGELVAAAVAFFTDEEPRALHSHVCGVSKEMQGRSVGFAVKQHQRAWALQRGIGTISWTVDPLVRRNVYFNLAKLGATVSEYLPDFYGQMRDGVNASDTSDRLLLTWSLSDERVMAASLGKPYLVKSGNGSLLLGVGANGEPVAGDSPNGDVLLCDVPPDIVRIRTADPPLARSWRQALRETLTGAMSDGYHVAGVTPDGRYVLTR